jgi:antitoxin component YwqK of YwqJK toxin-antitoxin module/Tfp pilus assembly protein PilF
MKYHYYLFLLLAVLCKASFAQKIELVNSGDVIKQSITLYDSARYKDALKLLTKVNRSDTNYVWSVYEKAVNCSADSQYTQSIKYCQEALALTTQREYEPELYNTYGNALDDLGQPEKALKVFDAAIAKYPAYSLLYFNKGIAYIALKRYADAEAMFQKTLLINPYMYSAHFQLGIVALQEGKIMPAFLSIVGYLLVNPEGKYWSRSIGLLDKISKGTDEILEYKKNKTGPPDETYAEVEDIVLSKIALDKSYKPLVSIDDPISRQIQAVFEKLEYQKDSKDFWIQYYLPYYKQVFSQGKFESFIFHAFSNVNLPVVKDYNKKHKKELDKFIEEAADYFNQIRYTRHLNYSERDTIKQKYYYEDGRLIGKGELSADKKNIIGPWLSYYGAGNKKAIGAYNSAGEKIGTWTYYFYSGVLKAKETYTAGKLNGTQEYYFENGNLSSLENFVNGSLEGISNTYNYGGNIKSAATYKQGKKDGVERKYYANGSLLEVNNYTNDALNGIATEYFKNGKVKSTSHYSAGKADGPYKASFETLGIANEGQFVKDNAEGEWKFYYESGKIKEKRSYVNNNEDGPHTEYYENGQVSVTYTVKKGKITGEAVYYREDGKVWSKYVYDNSIIVSVNYADAAGRQLYSAESKTGITDLVTYSKGGYKKMHRHFNAKYELEGPDTLFYPSGKVNEINEYKNDKLNGTSLTWYPSGKKKSEIPVVDNESDGYAVTYHANGTPEAEGWMKAGQHQGEWNYYDEKGRLSSRSYYLNNDLDGYKETYSPNGKKNLEEKYHLGWLEKMTQYDTTEKVIAVDTFPKATGKYKLVYDNGKPMLEGNYVKGEFDGPFKTYYFDGSLESSYVYKRGGIDSMYVSYRYGGKKKSEGMFNNGDKTGTWKFYGEDGKLSGTNNYVNDELSGEKTYYFENGVKDYIGTYKAGVLDGPVKKYDPDGSLAYQINFEDDKAISYSYLAADGKLTPAAVLAYNNGTLKTYFANGKLSRECSYSDGVKNGHDVMYYTNGQIRDEDSPVYGLAFGVTKIYYPNGKLKSVYSYNMDNANGIGKEYYLNGNIKKEMSFDNDEYHGPTKYFDENGKLMKTMWYYYDKLIAVK